uniref:peptide-methionine (S)-S-oxide reductase n=1 Tax=Meloidogyne incognita TaxID=6306 RepID=A0A914NN61_MELIC
MSKSSLAYLGMQCFWGSESTFALLPGVLKTRVGYSGGTSPSPTYQNIGDHTEIVEIQFNPELTKFKEIINLFYSKHNFTLPQKTQYKSVILYVDEEQKKIALEEMEKAKEKYNKNTIFYTFLQKFEKFYQAEDYHQKYWLRCENNIFKELNLSNSQLINSTLATKINGYLSGNSKEDFNLLNILQKEYKLSDSLITKIKEIALKGGIGNCH